MESMIKNIKQYKVFIAGSKDLSDQRNILRAVLMRKQVEFNVMIETKTFEDFSDALITMAVSTAPVFFQNIRLSRPPTLSLTTEARLKDVCLPVQRSIWAVR